MNTVSIPEEAYPLPANEELRLRTLQQLEILDTPIEHSFEKITRFAQRLFSVPMSAITLVDKDRQWFKSIQGLNARETPRHQSLCTYAIMQDDVLIIPDTLKDRRFKNNPAVVHNPNIRFYAGCPIRVGNNIHIGTLCVFDQKPRTFTKHEVSCLKELTKFVEDEISNHISNFVVNQENKILANELSKLKRIAAIDTLTQLWNRLGVKKYFESLQSKTLRTKQKFAIGIIDVDDFKSINDTYGHAAGDLTLKQIGVELINGVRKMDIVGRWGGDEFIILLDMDDKAKIQEIFERINQNIKNLKIVYNKNIFSISVTIGVTICDPNKLNKNIGLDEMLTKADERLYEGKRSGNIGKVFYCE
ncbi:MAG: sensor domain-containing diguanylate cyclase [Gammaproteobacteria bacterium]|nr:sensor domain-containing diguanylate cyclase [Gammaproteobacteria bacterium]